MKNFETIINDFFNRNSFEAIELENLRNHIKSSLSHNEYKLYENIINLNLVKFKLSDIKSKNCSDLDHLNKTIESNHNILVSCSDVGAKKPKGKDPNKISIDDLALDLGLPGSTLLFLLNKNKFNIKSGKTFLTKEMFQSIKTYVNERRYIHKNADKKTLSVGKSSGARKINNVFDQMYNTKGYIKLIYIRSK